MTDRELMQQALEALELEDMACRYEKDTTPAHIANAITALRDRLAQPEQEPVWIQPNHLQLARRAPFLCRVEPKQRDDFVPIYTAPPQRKPLPPQSPCEMTQAEGRMFKLGWLECEAAHGIKGDA